MPLLNKIKKPPILSMLNPRQMTKSKPMLSDIKKHKTMMKQHAAS